LDFAGFVVSVIILSLLGLQSCGRGCYSEWAWRGRQSVNLTVNVGMAVPAFTFSRSGQTDHIETVRVASKTVGLDYGDRAGRQAEHLRFGPHGEDVRMLNTVGAFERQLRNRVVVGDVAINADGYSTVAAPLPGSVRIGHDVTVHARFGGFREI